MTRGITARLTAVRKYIRGTVICQSISFYDGRAEESLRQTWINIWPSIANAYEEQICWSGSKAAAIIWGQLEISGGNKELLPLI